jgi:hypothetical protein
MGMEDITTTLEVVMLYQEETKHRFDRYARALHLYLNL